MIAPQGKVLSPCISICRINEASGWCEGCLRTIDEIAAWGSQSEDSKKAILGLVEVRRNARCPPNSQAPSRSRAQSRGNSKR